MTLSKPIILIGIPGMVASCFGGAYTFSIQKLRDLLKDELLKYDSSHDEDWKILQKVLNNDTSYKHLTTVGLNKIQETSNKDPQKGDKLREWCKNAADTKVSMNENLNTTWQNALIDAAAKFCILTIKQKLEKPIELGGSDAQQALQANISKLRNPTPPEEKLNDELSYIKTKAQDDQAWKDLKDWCGTIYTKGYNNPDDMDWLLAKKYCQKND